MELTEDIKGTLRNLKIEGAHVRIEEKLDRKAYQKVNEVLESLGGTWSRAKKAHVFPEDPTSRLAELAGAAKVTTVREKKRADGWFPTPEALADELARAADIQPGDRVLEPSAGDGALVKALFRAAPFARVTAVEIDGARAERIPVGCAVFVTDFLAFEYAYWFDRVVMNPPWVKTSYLQHVLHAFSMLKSGGTLVSVLPAGVKDRKGKAFTAFWRALSGSHWHTHDLPEGSFKSSGTNVNACVLVIKKS